MNYYKLIESDNYYSGYHLAIISMLKNLSVNALICNLDDGVIFKIPEQEISKLPTDKTGFYLPCSEDAGFSLFTEKEFFAVFKKKLPVSEDGWNEI
jgi:hypothetical protein